MATVPPGKKECSHCGTWVDEKFSHCSKCGKKLKKESGAVGVILVLGVVIGIIWLFSSAGGDDPSSTFLPRATDVPPNAFVVYRVDGTANRVDLTIENESGGTEQVDNVRLPYHKQLIVPRGQFVYLSAQNQGETGSVKCTITVDGDVLETAESSGSFVIASCSGSAR